MKVLTAIDTGEILVFGKIKDKDFYLQGITTGKKYKQGIVSFLKISHDFYFEVVMGELEKRKVSGFKFKNQTKVVRFGDMKQMIGVLANFVNSFKVGSVIHIDKNNKLTKKLHYETV